MFVGVAGGVAATLVRVRLGCMTLASALGLGGLPVAVFRVDLFAGGGTSSAALGGDEALMVVRLRVFLVEAGGASSALSSTGEGDAALVVAIVRLRVLVDPAGTTSGASFSLSGGASFAVVRLRPFLVEAGTASSAISSADGGKVAFVVVAARCIFLLEAGGASSVSLSTAEEALGVVIRRDRRAGLGGTIGVCEGVVLRLLARGVLFFWIVALDLLGVAVTIASSSCSLSFVISSSTDEKLLVLRRARVERVVGLAALLLLTLPLRDLVARVARGFGSVAALFRRFVGAASVSS